MKEFVAIIIRRANGDFFVHQRASNKERFPDYFALGAGGTVEPGEPAEQAAARELTEETGLSAPLQHLFSFEFEYSEAGSPVELQRNHVYLVNPGAFEPGTDPHEWRWSGWLSKEEVDALHQAGKLCPDTAAYYERYRQEDNRRANPVDLFNGVAELYEEVRPGYPREITDALCRLAGFGPQSKVLEIGAGTGHLSLPLAETGALLTCLEPAPALAQIAGKKLLPYPACRVVQSTFEDWPPAGDPFDAIICAQAAHFLKLDLATPKIHSLLKAKGHLVFLWNLDDSQETEFWKQSNFIYQKYLPGSASGRTSSPLNEKAAAVEKHLTDSGLFQKPTVKEHSWKQEYGRADYLRLASTFSDHLALAPDTRAAFHRELGDLIDSLGGRITRLYRTRLWLARRAVTA